MIEGRLRHTQTAVHTFFIYRRGFQGNVLVGFIGLRQASGPDLGGTDASADGAEDALVLPLLDEVFFYQSSGYCAHRTD